MKAFTTVVMFIVIAVITVTLSANDKVRELKLQQAIDLIESKGDLARATPLLEDVAKSTDRALAVRGLLHLAQAQERYGKGDTVATYQRIVTEFGGTNDAASVAAVVKEARSKLSALGQRTQGLSAKQVWDQAADYVSQDGQYLSFIDWTTGDLVVHDIATGRDRRLTNNGTWNGNFAEISVPSSDGRRIVYGWYDSARDAFELRVVGRDGGRSEFFFANPDPKGSLLPYGWTHDDKWVLATMGPESPRECTLVLIPVAGGAPRSIKKFENCFGRNFRFSPDDSTVAYDRPARPGNPRRAVFSVSVKNGVEEPLLPDGANETMLGWFPSGDRILFASDRGGTTGIWQTRVANGRATGDPVLVRRETGTVYGLGFTRRGEFHYTARESELEVMIADLDPATGRLTTGPSPLKSRFVGLKRQAAWSPNGDRIAFVQAPVVEPIGPVRDQKLAIQTVATGEVRLLTVALQNLQNPVWLPDGRALIVQGRNLTASQGLHRVDAETGAVTTIASRQATDDTPRALPAPAPDGRQLFFSGGAAPSPAAGIRVRDLSLDTEKRLTQVPAGSFALSPNSQWLAVNETQPDSQVRRRLRIIPSSGGEPRPVSPVIAAWDIRGPVTWSADSQWVFVVRMGERDQELWQVPIDGGAPRDTGVRWSGSIVRISAHPNGTRLALSTTGTSHRSMVLQNIPPQR